MLRVSLCCLCMGQALPTPVMSKQPLLQKLESAWGGLTFVLCRYSTSLLHWVVFPDRSMPSNRMKAPRCDIAAVGGVRRPERERDVQALQAVLRLK